MIDVQLIDVGCSEFEVQSLEPSELRTFERSGFNIQHRSFELPNQPLTQRVPCEVHGEGGGAGGKSTRKRTLNLKDQSKSKRPGRGGGFPPPPPQNRTSAINAYGSSKGQDSHSVGRRGCARFAGSAAERSLGTISFAPSPSILCLPGEPAIVASDALLPTQIAQVPPN